MSKIPKKKKPVKKLSERKYTWKSTDLKKVKSGKKAK